MKQLRHILIISIFGFFAAINYSCSSESQSKDVGDKDSTAAIPVEMASAQRGSISAYYSTTATLEAEEEAMVVAKVRGVINKLNVERLHPKRRGDGPAGR